MIVVSRAPAFATIQDGGRDGYRRSGVPPGGAMDRLSLQLGNVLLGNAPNAAAIEWALTGGVLRFERTTEIALTGASVDARLGGTTYHTGEVRVARAGEILEIERLTEGRFLYVCVRGGLDIAEVLGGRGTYLPAAFGGISGRRLARDDRLPVREAPAWKRREVNIDQTLRALSDRSPLRVLPGPQATLLEGDGLEKLVQQEFTLAPESDRAGYRLSRKQRTEYSADAPSEPACVGAVQITPDGNLIVLMPDGPTVGGYPKIAVVATCDLPRLAQMAPGDRVRFREATRKDTVNALRQRADAIRRILSLTRPESDA